LKSIASPNAIDRIPEDASLARMCGRVRASSRARAVERASACFASDLDLDFYERRERECDLETNDTRDADANAGPGSSVVVVTREDGARARVARATFGMTRDATRASVNAYDRAINARGETLSEVPMFANAIARDARCAVFVDGFYEWRSERAGAFEVKQPYYASRRDGEPMALAGVYADEDDMRGTRAKKRAFAIVTRSTKGGTLEWLHDRAPVMLHGDDDVRRWVLGSDWERCIECRAGEAHVKWYPVSMKVNRADYRGEDANKETKREAERGVGSLAALFAAAPPSKKRKI